MCSNSSQIVLHGGGLLRVMDQRQNVIPESAAEETEIVDGFVLVGLGPPAGFPPGIVTAAQKPGIAEEIAGLNGRCRYLGRYDFVPFGRHGGGREAVRKFRLSLA